MSTPTEDLQKAFSRQNIHYRSSIGRKLSIDRVSSICLLKALNRHEIFYISCIDSDRTATGLLWTGDLLQSLDRQKKSIDGIQVLRSSINKRPNVVLL